jgi:5'-nucleotidase
MRILCTNDDGIHAKGLDCLIKIARALSDDVWVVAPHEEQSGAARSLTLTNPLRVRKIEERRFSISGTPTDAVMIAVTKLLGDKRPDLVLSGVNNGQNVAEDVTFSGTIAGALQGMTLGIPSIALSLARLTRDAARWATPEAHAPGLIRRLLEVGWPMDVVVNVNFPDCDPEDVAGVEATVQGHRDAFQLFAEERQDLRGGAYYWFGFSGKLSDPPPGTDLRAIYERRISVTPLHLALTHQESLKTLARALNGPPHYMNLEEPAQPKP